MFLEELDGGGGCGGGVHAGDCGGGIHVGELFVSEEFWMLVFCVWF